jgi:hypothetical protein
VEENIQKFEPLRTEIHPGSEGGLAVETSVPAGIVRLQDAGGEAKKALFFAGLLAFVSLAIIAVLIFGPGGDALVVWQEGDDRVLVEVP